MQEKLYLVLRKVFYKSSSDYDFFYKMLVKYKMKGMIANKNVVFGYRRSGGFSTQMPYITWLKLLTKYVLIINKI